MFVRLRLGSNKGTRGGGAKSALSIEERESVSRSAAAPDSIRRSGKPETGKHQPARAGGPRIKTYVAASVSQAILMARRELGEEAILIQTTPLEKSNDPARQYEVTFGVVPGSPAHEGATGTSAAKIESSRGSSSSSDRPQPDNADVAEALGSLRREIATLHSALVNSALGKGGAPLGIGHVPQLYSMLVRHNVDPDLAEDLARGVEERLEKTVGNGRSAGDPNAATADGDADWTQHLMEHLRSRVRTDETLGYSESAGRAVLLVGPQAVGKTTTLIKLALEFGLKRGKRVEILSVDRFKPEGNRTLQSMAGVLNIPYQELPSVTALALALSRSAANGALILVDTGGYGSGSIEQQTELAEFAQSGRDADVHLVLPATWHSASIRQAVDRFEIFQPTKLLFTMFDQTAVYGSVIQEAWRTEKPLSFFSSGPLGSGSIKPARLEEIVALMTDSDRDSAH